MLEERKNIAGKIATLEEKLRKDREEVGRLTGRQNSGLTRGDGTATAKDTASPSVAPALPGSGGANSAAAPTNAPASNHPSSSAPGSATASVASGSAASAQPANSAVAPVAAVPNGTGTVPKLFNEQPPSKELL